MIQMPVQLTVPGNSSTWSMTAGITLSNKDTAFPPHLPHSPQLVGSVIYKIPIGEKMSTHNFREKELGDSCQDLSLYVNVKMIGFK